MASELSREEMDFLAAEYVLGVLEDDERASAGRLADGNGTMRALVEGWERRLSPMLAGYPVLAAPDVWPALDREIFAPRRRRNRIFWLAVAGLAVVLVAKIAFWLRLLT